MDTLDLKAFDDAHVLTGPTASGKTALALALAEEIDAEIISMDSMALYRGMDIGTAKPTVSEREQIPHHLVDVREPWESATVTWWLEQAAACCRDIRGRGKVPLFVGGTPFYLKAMLFGLFEGPPGDEELRAKLEDEAEHQGADALHQRLAQVDAASAQRLHVNDIRRVVRALEVWQLTGKPLSEWQQQWSQAEPVTKLNGVWLDWPRSQLHDRINRRVEAMFAGGLIDEVEQLRRLPQPLSREARQALGYKEVLAYLEGTATREETIDLVQTRTRQFAKRQITWFRHLPSCQPLPGELTIEQFKETMKERGFCAGSGQA